ncbi:MAG: protease inhibitor I42 family protein [Candidatus Omnitrophota bacterium]|jgi:inhibitor of cysteine peptidase
MNIAIYKKNMIGLTAFLFFGLIIFCLISLARNNNRSNTITVKSGGTFTISLASNATTGFTWQFVRQIDTNLLGLEGSRYLSPGTGLVGAGGRQEWTFRAKKPGRAVISLEYIRPWENDKACARAKNLTVIIR